MNVPRSEHYRQQATQLRKMASGEIAGSGIWEQLLELARQYDRLAERAEDEAGNG